MNYIEELQDKLKRTEEDLYRARKILGMVRRLLSEDVERVEPEMVNLAAIERRAIIKALELSEGNRARTADMLGIARSTMFVKLRKLGIVGHRSGPI